MTSLRRSVKISWFIVLLLNFFYQKIIYNKLKIYLENTSQFGIKPTDIYYYYYYFIITSSYTVKKSSNHSYTKSYVKV